MTLNEGFWIRGNCPLARRIEQDIEEVAGGRVILPLSILHYLST